METGYFIEMVFPVYRTRFISISDNFDSNEHIGDTGGMEVAFKFIMNDFYSQDLSKKTRTAKYIKMKRGEHQSKICIYGYKKGSDGRLEVDTETSEVVKLIFTEALKMKSATDIVKILYDKKIPTPSEYRKLNGCNIYDTSRSMGIWQGSTIIRMLKDERYMGTYVMGRQTVKEIGSKKMRMKAEDEWIKIPNHHTPIISAEIFKQVNDRLLNFKYPNRTSKNYLFKSKLYCGCCHHAMEYLFRKVPKFMCRYTKVDKTAKCHKFIIEESRIEDIVFEIINKQAQIILNLDGVGDASEINIKTEQQNEYEKMIDNCNEEKCDLYEQFVLGKISADEYKNSKASIETELQRFTQALNNLKTDTSALKIANDSNKQLKEIAKTIVESGKLNSSLVDILIDKIYIYPDNNIEIFWKVKDFYTSM